MTIDIGYAPFAAQLYYVAESSFAAGPGAGTPVAPEAIDGADVHIPFNPVEGGFRFTPTHKQYDPIARIGNNFESWLPVATEPQDLSIEATYHWPRLAREAFNVAEIGAWTDDATAWLKFTALAADQGAARNSIAIHSHQPDSSGAADVDCDWYGCVVEDYSWRIESGGYLQEAAGLRAANHAENVQAMNADANFHEMGWAYWNSQLKAGNVQDGVLAVPSDLCSAGAFSAFDDDLAFTSVEFSISCERELKQVGSMMTVSMSPRKNLVVRLTFEGVLVGKTPFSEAWSTLDARSAATGYLRWDKTPAAPAYYEQLSCTEMFLLEPGEIGLAEADGSVLAENTCVFAATSGSALEFNGNYKQADTADPLAYFGLTRP